MRPFLLLLLVLLLPLRLSLAAEPPDFPLTEDSKPKPDVPKGELIKDTFKAWGRYIKQPDGPGIPWDSVFPGTVRDYTLYLPPGFDKTKPAPFMVFQDGVIYQAPTVFDNLIAKKEIPPLVGIFVKPGVVPAANENVLPRFNRSYEYDSVTDNYATFLIDELLPAIERDHEIKLSTNPNDAGISGNSSGGIAAFMVAWHRPDRFRRVFTGVGTYVGIHGADQLPVLIRKFEPKPIKVFLQSGTGDNNLYCGDWWMANQMMERSLTWAGYDVNHAWGEGGHNQKHASQIFPDVLRWLWKGWPENEEVKANPRGDSQWKGSLVVGDGEWQKCYEELPPENGSWWRRQLTPRKDGTVFFEGRGEAAANGESLSHICKMLPTGEVSELPGKWCLWAMAMGPDGALRVALRERQENGSNKTSIIELSEEGQLPTPPLEVFDGTGNEYPQPAHMCYSHDGWCYFTEGSEARIFHISPDGIVGATHDNAIGGMGPNGYLCLSPDQRTLYASGYSGKDAFWAYEVHQSTPFLRHGQPFGDTQHDIKRGARGEDGGTTMCVDTNGWIYVATSQGIQVLDQCGRTNFIIATPKPVRAVCFGGTDLSDLVISCGDNRGSAIYKRPTKARGIVSAQMPPIKPAPPKL